MKRTKSTFSIPDLSFAWKKTLGITQRRQKIARETGISTSELALNANLGK